MLAFCRDKEGVRLQMAMRAMGKPDYGWPMSRARLWAKLYVSLFTRPSMVARIMEKHPGQITSEILECLGDPARLWAHRFGGSGDLFSPLPDDLPLGLGGGGGGAMSPPAFPYSLPHLPTRGFITRADVKMDKVLAKLMEFSAAEGAAGGRALTADNEAALRGLADVLSRPHLFETSACPAPGLAALLDTLAWAPERLFASLDMLRVAVLHRDCALQLATVSERVLPALLDLCGGPGGGNDYRVPLVAARALANMCNHRAMRTLFTDALPLVLSCALALLRHVNESVRNEGANLLYNSAHAGIDAVTDNMGKVRALPAFLTAPTVARFMQGINAALDIRGPSARTALLQALGSLIMINGGLRDAGAATIGIAALREGLKQKVTDVAAQESAAEVKEIASEVLLLLTQVEANNPHL